MLRRLSFSQIHFVLAIVLFASLILSAGIGAFSYTPNDMLHYLGQAVGWIAPSSSDALDRNVFIQLRLPRVLMAALTGAVLGVSGALMQGLFRNPIVEPGLAGTSAGAALGAALVFVLGGGAAGFASPLGAFAVPL